MGRPKRVKSRVGDFCELVEQGSVLHRLELFANCLYGSQDVCVGIYSDNTMDGMFQTTIGELEQLVADFKKLRGVQRVRKTCKLR